MEMAAPPGKVYEILSDYNNCDRVYHNISKSRVEDVRILGGRSQLTVTQVRSGGSTTDQMAQLFSNEYC